MPRPCKRRRVCGHPSCGRFGPAEQAHGQPEVLMGLDEFETIRLIDLEGLTQEQCARADERSAHHRAGHLRDGPPQAGTMPGERARAGD